jgi:hypothetical protein
MRTGPSRHRHGRSGRLGSPAANAATTCTFDPTFHVLSVGMDADGDQTVLAVGPSGDIQVRGGGTVLSCSGGTHGRQHRLDPGRRQLG